jgi:hypothetical protein
MRRQLLDPVGTLDLTDTVRALCGAQAQVPSAAELALALRRRGGQVGEADRALRDRKLMRTWAMRGTLHLLAPDDAGAYLALIAARRPWERPAWQREFGVTTAEIHMLAEAVDEVLDGNVLDRDQLIVAIAAKTGNRTLEQHLRSGWGVLLKPMAWMGLLCNGPSRGNRVTFTNPRTWLPEFNGLPDVDTAALIAITSYLSAFGPARAKTFDAWLVRGASRAADLRRWFELVADQLVTVDVEGEQFLALTAQLEELRSTAPSRAVRLLAGFDQYLLGPGTADPRIVAPTRRRLVSKAAGWISPVVLDGGRVAGVWEIDRATLSVSLFSESDAVDRHALAAEAQRVGDCLGSDLELSIETV